jgi:hypothetical protein
MDKKTMGIVAVVIVIIAALWLMSGKKQAPESNGNVSPSPTTSQPQVKDEPNPSPAQDNSNTWSGFLKTSNNPAKGNLMLQTSDRTIYIKTSRDYSSLLDKYVVVVYEGSYENFVLGNILEAKGE